MSRIGLRATIGVLSTLCLALISVLSGFVSAEPRFAFLKGTTGLVLLIVIVTLAAGLVVIDQVILGRGATKTERRLRDRQLMIARIEKIWIDGMLQQQLRLAPQLSLRFRTAPEAVARPWAGVVSETATRSRLLPPKTTITEIYSGAGGSLLILGAPGAGKTVQLLILLTDLLKWAKKSRDHPIPVVFNLRSWARHRRPIREWLERDLFELYGVPRRLAKSWIDDGQILPLLDDLDGVGERYRAACVAEINRFHVRDPSHLVPVVVCSRAAGGTLQILGHERLREPLRLQSAVI